MYLTSGHLFPALLNNNYQKKAGSKTVIRKRPWRIISPNNLIRSNSSSKNENPFQKILSIIAVHVFSDYSFFENQNIITETEHLKQLVLKQQKKTMIDRIWLKPLQ